MAPPRRTAGLGSKDSVLDDLFLARDAVGLARCSADRLQGTLHLTYGGMTWSSQQLVAVRAWILAVAKKVCEEYAASHADDRCSRAAADSLLDILGSPADGSRTANALRRRARERHGCVIADDSLRKREQPVLEALADDLYYRLHVRPVSELPSSLDLMHWMAPYVALAGLTVEDAASTYPAMMSLPNKNMVADKAAQALWSVARLVGMPAQALQQLRLLGSSGIEDQILEHILLVLIRSPFPADEQDAFRLAATEQPDNPDDATEWMGILLQDPQTSAMVNRFLVWLASHRPQTCLHQSNLKLIGYCGPHYFAAVCDSFEDVLDDYQTGTLRRDTLNDMTKLGLRTSYS